MSVGVQWHWQPVDWQLPAQLAATRHLRHRESLQEENFKASVQR